MSLFSLSSAELHRLIQLVKEKETIQVKLAHVKRSLDALQNGEETKEPTIQKRRSRRGALKDGILKELEAVGKEGLTVIYGQ